MTLVPIRAAGRVAWRGARRNLRRSLLIISMVALPVMLVTAVAAIARTSLSSPAEAAAWEAVTFVAGALALFVTGLIAAAAFVVGARRQLRELGLVSAIGGERRHVVAVVLLGGTTLGFLGSIVGALVGIAVAYLVHPLLDDFIKHSVGPVEISPLAVIGAVAMGTGAATLAVLAPARAAAKISTLDALAGRGGAPRPPGRLAGGGLLTIVVGGLLTAVGTQSDHDIPLVAGVIAMLSGFLLSIPLLVAIVGRMASRLPMTGRLAARDAARHGRRTGAAVAAAAIALSLPVAVSTYSLSKETYERRSRRLGDNQLLIGPHLGIPSGIFGGMDEVVRDLRREFPGAVVVEVDNNIARELGLQDSQGAFLLTGDGPFSRRDIDRAHDVTAEYPGFFIVGEEDYLPQYAFARTTVAVVSFPVALAIVAVAVALVASESRRSRQILVAVGAGPMSHRKLLAATSWLLALIAAVLAVPGGLLPLLVVWATAGQSDLPFVIPWATIGIVVFFVPLLAALVSSLVARTPRLGSLLRPAV